MVMVRDTGRPPQPPVSSRVGASDVGRGWQTTWGYLKAEKAGVKMDVSRR